MKGKKLFGKLNIVDLVVILVVVAAAVFFAFRYLNVGGSGADSSVEAEYTVVIEAMPKTLYEEIAASLPAKMISAEHDLDGTVVSSTAEPCTVEKIETNDNYNSNTIYTIIPGENDQYVRAVFTCRASISSSVLNKFGEQELRIGRQHILKTRTFELVGTVASMTIPSENS
jgi:hypothetical protein